MQSFFCLTLVVGCSRSLTTPTLTPIPTPVPKPTKSPSEIQASIRPLLMVHYMPWYQTPSVSGSWGWHWTMDHFDPNQKDENGHSAIASHSYPLTGPYDSKDDAVLEYQVMLMKMSGIDGLIVDWYGFDNFWDYGTINTSTQKLFQYARKAGLLFAICYEDRTIDNMIKNGYLNSKEAVSHGQQTMLYLQNNWFRDESYLKSSGHPVLFVFGHPPYFSSSSDWVSLFSVLDTAPMLITEDDPLEPIASSSYPWPPMFMSLGGALTQDALNGYLTSFYKKAESWDYVVASAFPGFHDIYKEAGVGNGYGYLDSQNGETFNFTLQTALQSDPDIIQLVTWNDYGEGTNIEPTVEFGYQYLEIIQNTRRASIDKEFAFTPDDLSLPLQIFNLRRQYQADPQVNARLDEAFNAIVSGRLETAREIIASYSP
jgi:hypothetical protein